MYNLAFDRMRIDHFKFQRFFLVILDMPNANHQFWNCCIYRDPMQDFVPGRRFQACGDDVKHRELEASFRRGGDDVFEDIWRICVLVNV